MAKRTTSAASAATLPEFRGSPKTQERLAHIYKRTQEEPGILSATLANELDITSLQCSQLGDRLVNQGLIEVFKLANGARANFLPKDLAKILPRLEKQRETEIAARKANADTDKAEKFRQLKEKAAAKKAAEAADKPAGKRVPGKAAEAKSTPAPAEAPAARKRRRAA